MICASRVHRLMLVLLGFRMKHGMEGTGKQVELCMSPRIFAKRGLQRGNYSSMVVARSSSCTGRPCTIVDERDGARSAQQETQVNRTNRAFTTHLGVPCLSRLLPPVSMTVSVLCCTPPSLLLNETVKFSVVARFGIMTMLVTIGAVCIYLYETTLDVGDDGERLLGNKRLFGFE